MYIEWQLWGHQVSKADTVPAFKELPRSRARAVRTSDVLFVSTDSGEKVFAMMADHLRTRFRLRLRECSSGEGTVG